jgi:hypothetical protein
VTNTSKANFHINNGIAYLENLEIEISRALDLAKPGSYLSDMLTVVLTNIASINTKLSVADELTLDTPTNTKNFIR